MIRENVSNTRMFEDAGKAKKLSNFVIIFIIAFGMFIGGSLIGEILGLIGLAASLPAYMSTSMFQLIGGFGAATLLCITYVRKVEKRRAEGIGFYKDGALNKYLRGFLIGAGLMAVVVVMGIVTGGMKIKFNPTMGGNIIPIMFMLLGFIVQGGTEEVLTRGWVLPVVGKKHGIKVGIIVSTVLFTLLHGMNPGMTILPIINLTLFAIFAAVYVIDEKSIWGICGMHSAWNWFQGNIFGIKVSGNTMVGGSILNTEAVEGMDFLSGGNFGAEGSILCSLVFLAGIIYFTLRIKKNYDFK